MFNKKQRPETGDVAQSDLRCSFCNKSQHDVRKLIAGPSVYICDECVSVCEDIIANDSRFAETSEIKNGRLVDEPPKVPVAGLAIRCALCLMPTPVDDGLLIPNRGVLCPGCIGEVEAAVAQKHEFELGSET
jgi:hypothetical protein